MDFIQVIVLAVVQGITEFLPVSSSAHLIVVPTLLKWPDQGVVFDISLHLGTLLAVMAYFKKETRAIAQGTLDIALFRRDTAGARMVFQLVLATIPIIFLALFLSDWQSNAGRNVKVLAWASIGFGILLGAADCMSVRHGKEQGVTMRDAFIFGLFQSLAIIPGTSRSGICVTAGRFLGYNRHTSGRFATLMALPTITIAGLYSLMKTDVTGLNWQVDAPVLLLGIAISFVVALIGIKILMSFLARVGYWPFMVYRILLGAVLLAFL